MSSTERYMFLTEEEFVPSDRIAEPAYVLNVSAHIIAIVLCLLLFQMIWASDLPEYREVSRQYTDSFYPLKKKGRG